MAQVSRGDSCGARGYCGGGVGAGAGTGLALVRENWRRLRARNAEVLRGSSIVGKYMTVIGDGEDVELRRAAAEARSPKPPRSAQLRLGVALSFSDGELSIDQ